MTCIVCGKVENGCPDSHGYCHKCAMEVLIPLIRPKQLEEGYTDCFGKGDINCPFTDCKYREVCLDL